MFDTREQFTFSVLSGGEKVATVRYPTDEELIQRTKRLKSVRRELGRGLSEFDITNSEQVELEIFEKIFVESKEPFDAYEALDYMGQMLNTEVTESHRNGSNSFVVEMQVPVGKDVTKKVIHTLRMPTQKDVVEYKRESVRAVQAKRHIEVRHSIEPALRLWDKYQVSTEGYAEGSPVPANHKDRAMLEVMDLMRQITEGSDPER